MNWELQHLHTASFLLKRAKRNLIEKEFDIHQRIKVMLDIANAKDSLDKVEKLQKQTEQSEDATAGSMKQK